MNSYRSIVQIRCVGALIRKPRTWPPLVSVSLSAAAKLAESRKWPPAIWAVVQTTRVRTSGSEPSG